MGIPILVRHLFWDEPQILTQCRQDRLNTWLVFFRSCILMNGIQSKRMVKPVYMCFYVNHLLDWNYEYLGIRFATCIQRDVSLFSVSDINFIIKFRSTAFLEIVCSLQYSYHEVYNTQIMFCQLGLAVSNWMELVWSKHCNMNQTQENCTAKSTYTIQAANDISLIYMLSLLTYAHV